MIDHHKTFAAAMRVREIVLADELADEVPEYDMAAILEILRNVPPQGDCHGFEPPSYMPGCGCLMSSICMNSACPHRVIITSDSEVGRIQ